MATPDGVTRLASHAATSRSFPDHPAYTRIGYSNHTAPAAGALGELNLDGQVTIVAADGTRLRRRTFELLAAGDRFAASTWVPEPSPPSLRRRPVARALGLLPWRIQPRRLRSAGARDERVESTSVARIDMELRITHLWSLDGGVIRDGGLAVSHDTPPVVSRGDGWSLATNADGLSGAVVGLHGYGDSGWSADLDASPFGRHSVVPYVDGTGDSPEAILIAAHVLTYDPVDPDAIRAACVVEILNQRAVMVHFADGEHHLVQVFRPGSLRVRVGHLNVDGTYRYARSSPDGSSWSFPAF
jgi:hypothetical protein